MHCFNRKIYFYPKTNSEYQFMSYFKIMKYIFFILLLITTFYFTIGCSEKMNAKNAEKQLKAFDSELILLAKQFARSTAYQAMQQLYSYKNLPVPYRFNANNGAQSIHTFDFEKQKGIYKLDTSTNEFNRYRASDSIVIIFPFKSSHDSLARFVISQYSESLSAWETMMPTYANISLEIKGKKEIQLLINGKMEHHVPVDYLASVQFEKIKADLSIRTKPGKHKSRMQTDLTVFSNNKQKASIKTSSLIKVLSNGTMLFDKVKFETTIFPLHISGFVNYGAIKHEKNSFVTEFNSNSKISIHETQQNKKVGSVILSERPMHDKINIAVVYNDGSTIFLEDLLLSIREIMNIKL